MRRWVTPRSAVGTRLGMRLHGTDCASTAPIASARHRLRRHGTDCVGTAPIASAWHRLRRHGTDCVGMAPIASAWHRLRRHGTDCAGTAPIAPARHRLRRHGTDCAGTAPGDHHRPTTIDVQSNRGAGPQLRRNLRVSGSIGTRIPAGTSHATRARGCRQLEEMTDCCLVRTLVASWLDRL
jgi:hypothetical protein